MKCAYKIDVRNSKCEIWSVIFEYKIDSKTEYQRVRRVDEWWSKKVRFAEWTNMMCDKYLIQLCK